MFLYTREAALLTTGTLSEVTFHALSLQLLSHRLQRLVLVGDDVLLETASALLISPLALFTPSRKHLHGKRYRQQG